MTRTGPRSFSLGRQSNALARSGAPTTSCPRSISSARSRARGQCSGMTSKILGRAMASPVQDSNHQRRHVVDPSLLVSLAHEPVAGLLGGWRFEQVRDLLVAKRLVETVGAE